MYLYIYICEYLVFTYSLHLAQGSFDCFCGRCWRIKESMGIEVFLLSASGGSTRQNSASGTLKTMAINTCFCLQPLGSRLAMCLGAYFSVCFKVCGYWFNIIHASRKHMIRMKYDMIIYIRFNRWVCLKPRC